jgi:hypothetical protein
MKVISYSLFGYNGQRYDNCFDFNSYLRGLFINLRLARLLFPDWSIHVEMDEETNEAFGDMMRRAGIITRANKRDALCKMMLWRMKPLFDEQDGKWKYSHVLCRDTDSPLTYKEAQIVNKWIQKDKCALAITDSISHTIPMMGGMVGFQSNGFHTRWSAGDFNSMFVGCDIDFNHKGSDQDFLNRIIYPKYAKHGEDSITQYYFKGMPNTFLTDFHNSIEYTDIGINEYESLDAPNICGHIGSAGYYNDVLYKELRKFKDKFKDIDEVESNYPEIFGWITERSL